MNTARPAALLLAALALTACGDGGTVAEPVAPAAAAQTTGKPVTVENCGRTVTFEEAPQRIVSGWPSSTELLLELGVGDRVVGQYNTSNGAPSAKNAAAYGAVEVLSPQVPSREVLLAAQPDLIWADGSYAFDGKTLPTIDELEDLGIQVLVLSGFCGDDATGARISDVRTDLAVLGTALGVEEEAEALERTVDQRLAAVRERVGGEPAVPVLFLSTYDKALYTYEGVYSDLAGLAGGTNLYAGKLPGGNYYGQVSVEEVTALDPATIVYLSTAGQTPEQVRADVAEALPTVSAVREGRVVVLPQDDSTNLSGVEGVEALAAALHP